MWGGPPFYATLLPLLLLPRSLAWLHRELTLTLRMVLVGAGGAGRSLQMEVMRRLRAPGGRRAPFIRRRLALCFLSWRGRRGRALRLQARAARAGGALHLLLARLALLQVGEGLDARTYLAPTN